MKTVSAIKSWIPTLLAAALASVMAVNKSLNDSAMRVLPWLLAAGSHATGILMIVYGIQLVHKAGECGLVCNRDWYSGYMLLIGASIVGASATELLFRLNRESRK